MLVFGCTGELDDVPHGERMAANTGPPPDLVYSGRWACYPFRESL